MPKKLIEVSLPLEAINAESSREKSIRHGHPSTLHLWWARRPLAAARAVLWASLVDDPSEHPELFPTEEAQTRERQRLHKLLAELVKWENSNNQDLLDQARAEIRKSMGDEPLEFLDPFAGGGSIPLEAQRLGLQAHAHDLNPVAVMINKAMIEIPPRFANQPPVNPDAREKLKDAWPGASGLANDVEYYGKLLKEKGWQKLGHLYPKVKLPAGGEATVIAWLWARTVKCPNPACGCEMPLASSFVLSKKDGNEAWVEPLIADKKVSFVAHQGKCPQGKESNKLGKGASFRCPACNAATEKQYIHDQFIARKDGAVLMAIVAEGKNGRVYLAPEPEQTEIAVSAKPAWAPDEEMNQNCTDLVSGRGYGITHWEQLFTRRQLTTLTTLSDLLKDVQAQAQQDAIAAGISDDGIDLAAGGKGATAYAEAIVVYLSFVIDKLSSYNSKCCTWLIPRELIRDSFGRQALPMVWDYAEANSFSNSSGCFDNMLDWVINCIKSLSATNLGIVSQIPAQIETTLQNLIISTDPPYYDNIGYADLSDYFYVWLRPNLKKIYPEIFKTILTPKSNELIAASYRFNGNKQKASQFFEDGMKQTFSQLQKSAREDVPVTIYYAFKQSETDQKDGQTASTGWETFLSGVLDSGFAITGTWPLRTERPGRTISLGTNALASSIVLVCRKRSADAPIATRRQFLNELHDALPKAIAELQAGNIAPVDLAQAAIGPGMAVFSRYRQVLEADGKPMPVRAALQAINAELDNYLSAQDGALDEATRFCVDLYSQFAFNDVKYGEAQVLATAKNTSIEALAANGLLASQKGYAHLLGREDLPEQPARPSLLASYLWLLTQYLVKAMESGGIEAAAKLAARYAEDAEAARDLAYRLHAVASRRGWTKEAFAYNALVTAWPEVRQQAHALGRQSMESGVLI